MPITKMKYGIDLGTTNSSLCKFENGVPVIIKTDTLKETMPSCVSFTKKRAIKVGDGAYNDLRADKSSATKKWTVGEENVFLEFKRTMGLDTKYTSSYMKKSYSSEELSAEVLKTLSSFLPDERITACVVTVPAKFKTDQIAATMRAAHLAGFKHCELLQEPIAAAFAYGLSAKEKDGNWLVFDFGGGTFDAALLAVQEGVLQVKDTEGDNYLGGKNLDFAIVDEIIIPYLKQNNTIDRLLSKPTQATILREGLKFYAEQAKNQLSSAESTDVTSQLDEFGNDDKGQEIELDLTITREQITPVLAPFFQKAIDICKKLLERNHLACDQINSVILVGGPTRSPLLRQMLREQISPNVNSTVDPMTAVALGAALYASTIDSVEEITNVENESVVALDISYEANTVETVEYVTVKILAEESTGTIPEKLSVEFVRSDNAWSSDKMTIGPKGEVFECYLLEDRPNTFSVRAYDEQGVRVNCFPKEISILQGTKILNAVLPYYIGIEITEMKYGRQKRDVFASLAGLEKNVLIPAVGTIKGLTTPRELRPGKSSDKLIVPIYQGEYDANGTTAMYNDHVFDVVITGNDVTQPVASTSPMDITIKVDRSQMLTLEVTFAKTGETIEKPIEIQQRKSIDHKRLKNFFTQAQEKLKNLQSSETIEAQELEASQKIMNDLESRFEGEKNFDDGRMHLLADIRRAFLAIESVEKNHEWDALEKKLDFIYEHIVQCNEHSQKGFDDIMKDATRKYNEAKERKDVAIAKKTIEELDQYYFGMTVDFQYENFIETNYTHFNPARWSQPLKAQTLLSRAMKLIATDYDFEELEDIMHSLGEIIVLNEGGDKAVRFNNSW